MTLDTPLDWLLLILVAAVSGIIGAAIGSFIVELFGWNR